MKDLKTIFDSGEIGVLYRVFAMLKYGVDDENDKLKVISSPIFKELFSSINMEIKTILNSRALDSNQQPVYEYIEQKEVPFQALKDNVTKCIKMYKGNPDGNWSEWKWEWKKEMVMNLASPYLILDTTVEEILKDEM